MIKVFEHTNDMMLQLSIILKIIKKVYVMVKTHNSLHILYVLRMHHTLAGAKQLHGKQLSYNNIKDADAALSLVKQFEQPAAVAEHMNPCVGVASSIDEAYQHAFEADSQSIFGGIVALNRTVEKSLAETLHGIFLEVIMHQNSRKKL